MATIIHNKEVFITVKEVLSYLGAFRADMEAKRQGCLDDIKKQDLLDPIRELSNTLTNLDYDEFIRKIDWVVEKMMKHLDKVGQEMSKEFG